MNYFETLGLNISFEIDLQKLEKNYLQLQKEFHPDAAETDKEKFILLSKSADINDGYKTLKNEYDRGAYILKLNDIDIKDENLRNHLDNDFLIYFFNLSEDLEETYELADLEIMNDNISSERNSLIHQISSSFKNSDLNNASLSLMKLKYYDNIIYKIEEKIQKCF